MSCFPSRLRPSKSRHPQTLLTRSTFPVRTGKGPTWQTHAQRRNLRISVCVDQVHVSGAYPVRTGKRPQWQTHAQRRNLSIFGTAPGHPDKRQPCRLLRGRPIRGLKMIVGSFGTPGAGADVDGLAPDRGWTMPLHELRDEGRLDARADFSLVQDRHPASILSTRSCHLHLNHAPRAAPCATETWRPMAIVRKMMETFPVRLPGVRLVLRIVNYPHPRCAIRHGP